MMRMLQTPVEVPALIGLRTLRLVCFTILLVPSFIVVASVIVSSMNSGIGWQQHRLPGVFLGIYVLAGLASPLVGAAALGFLFVGRRRFVDDHDSYEARLRRHIATLGVIDILSIVAWFPMFLFVFFEGVGGSR